jgi:hypothetical protein
MVENRGPSLGRTGMRCIQQAAVNNSVSESLEFMSRTYLPIGRDSAFVPPGHPVPRM